MLRGAGTIRQDSVSVALILRKRAAYPHRAWPRPGAMGRLAKILFMGEWLASPEVHRRVTAGLIRAQHPTRAGYGPRPGAVVARTYEVSGRPASCTGWGS